MRDIKGLSWGALHVQHDALGCYAAGQQQVPGSQHTPYAAAQAATLFWPSFDDLKSDADVALAFKQLSSRLTEDLERFLDQYALDAQVAIVSMLSQLDVYDTASA
jgi:hypothetical protein